MPAPRFPSLLDEALEAWEGTRAGVIDEAENIPADHYGFRPTEQSRSVAELILHIVEAGLMMVGELTHPEGDFRRQSYADHLAEHAGSLPADGSKDELVALLRRTGQEGSRRLREAGELAMLQGIQRFDGQVGTRFAWMNHGIDHESYHRGQLALYARLMGQVPALTRRIRGE